MVEHTTAGVIELQALGTSQGVDFDLASFVLLVDSQPFVPASAELTVSGTADAPTLTYVSAAPLPFDASVDLTLRADDTNEPEKGNPGKGRQRNGQRDSTGVLGQPADIVGWRRWDGDQCEQDDRAKQKRKEDPRPRRRTRRPQVLSGYGAFWVRCHVVFSYPGIVFFPDHIQQARHRA